MNIDKAKKIAHVISQYNRWDSFLVDLNNKCFDEPIIGNLKVTLTHGGLVMETLKIPGGIFTIDEIRSRLAQLRDEAKAKICALEKDDLPEIARDQL